MRYMADSTNGFDIPQGRFELVAGYVDGLYAWSGAMWKFHDSARHVTITVFGGSQVADVADVERGDLTPAQGADWALNMIRLGRYPTLYYSEYLDPQIQAEMGARGIHAFGIWRANWNNVPDLHPNDTAHQYADSAMVGAHYDVSVVRDYWPGVDPAPAPQPSPPPPPPAQGGAAGSLQGWGQLQVLVDVDLSTHAAGLIALQSQADKVG